MRRITQIFFALALVFSPVAYASYLSEFVSKPDAAYHWEVVGEKHEKDYSTYLISMTSQQWRTKEEVSQPKWNHWIKVVVPKDLQYKTPFLYISGGYNDNESVKEFKEEQIAWACDTKSIYAEITLIPNQVLKFADETVPEYKENGRREDGIIAYTWSKFLDTKDQSWPLQLPMTKSVVKAMDTLEAFFQKKNQLALDGFVIAGMSKRGWVSWTTASVDPRVKGVIPMVIDLLNIEESFTHHYNAYGFWSPAIKDYIEMGIVDHRNTEDFKELLTLVEPYEHRKKLKMPKYIVNSTGDEFFVTDSSQFYFHELKGEKYLRYVPNTHHTLKAPDTWASIQAFYVSILNQNRLPKFSWKITSQNALVVHTKEKPIEVNMWQATNPKKRDFRYRMIGDAWNKQSLPLNKKGEYKVKLNAPKEGWTAFFIELKFENGEQQPMVFTTDVYVCPDQLPFALEEKSGKS